MVATRAFDAGASGRFPAATHPPARTSATRELVPLDGRHRAGLLRSALDPDVSDATARGGLSASDWVENVVLAALRGRRAGRRFDFAVLAGDAFVGFTGLHFYEQRAELGELAYWIEADSRGHGHATAAGRGVARFAFDVLGVRVLQARIRRGNDASRRVLEKLGFQWDTQSKRYLLVREELARPPASEGDTVLVIRRSQRDAFQAGLDRRFVRAVTARLMEELPQTFAEADATELEDLALSALGRARAYGLTADPDMSAFVELALLISPRFDEHPFIAAALRDPKVAVGERMAALLARLSAEIWDDASQLR